MSKEESSGLSWRQWTLESELPLFQGLVLSQVEEEI